MSATSNCIRSSGLVDTSDYNLATETAMSERSSRELHTAGVCILDVDCMNRMVADRYTVELNTTKIALISVNAY